MTQWAKQGKGTLSHGHDAEQQHEYYIHQMFNLTTLQETVAQDDNNNPRMTLHSTLVTI